jgi:hypothetical protein
MSPYLSTYTAFLQSRATLSTQAIPIRGAKCFFCKNRNFLTFPLLLVKIKDFTPTMKKYASYIEDYWLSSHLVGFILFRDIFITRAAVH